MSYAGPVSRGKRAANREPLEPVRATGVGRSGSGVRRAPARGSMPDTTPPLAAFAAGIALGVLVGAGAALLFAPGSGADTRRALVRGGRRLRRRGHDAWEDLGDELRDAARRGRRALARRRRTRARRGEREQFEAID